VNTRLPVLAALAVMLAALPLAAVAQSKAQPPGVTEEAEPPAGPPRRTIFYESRTIIVTVRPPPATEDEARQMLNRAGPRCVRADKITEATMLDPRAVLLRLRSGDLLKITLAQDCPVLGYYGGFYVSRQADMLCAGRDFLLARSGQRCAISEIARARPRLTKAGQTPP